LRRLGLARKSAKQMFDTLRYKVLDNTTRLR
jgi:hypothetical protein